MLEIARKLSENRDKLNYSVNFVAFTNEENPYHFMGSENYINSIERKDYPDFFINLDMIGHYSDNTGSQKIFEFNKEPCPDKGDFIACLSRGNRYFEELGTELNNIISAEGLKTYKSFLDWKSVNKYNSTFFYRTDNFSFMKKWINSILFSDTAAYRENSKYHSADDTYEKLNYNKMSKIVKSISKFILGLPKNIYH